MNVTTKSLFGNLFVKQQIYKLRSFQWQNMADAMDVASILIVKLLKWINKLITYSINIIH